jgi:hypothetical protein
VINIVGMIYWLAIGIHFRREKRRESLSMAALKDLMAEKVK